MSTNVQTVNEESLGTGWPQMNGRDLSSLAPEDRQDTEKVLSLSTGLEADIERLTDDPMERLVYLALSVASGKHVLDLLPTDEILPAENRSEGPPFAKGRGGLDMLDIVETHLLLENVLNIELGDPASLDSSSVRSIARGIGDRLTNSPTSDSPQPPPIPESPLSVRAQKCVRCERELPQGAVLCTNCGTNQQSGQKISGAETGGGSSARPVPGQQSNVGVGHGGGGTYESRPEQQGSGPWTLLAGIYTVAAIGFLAVKSPRTLFLAYKRPLNPVGWIVLAVVFLPLVIALIKKFLSSNKQNS